MTALLAALRRADWARLAEWVVLAGVLAIAALISYTHLRSVWMAAHAPWPNVGPLLVDGLFAAAWLRMRRRRGRGERVGWLAWTALLLALVATLAGNVAAAFVDRAGWHWLAIIVAAWPALALALVWELATGHKRRAADDGAPVATPDGVLDAVGEGVGLPFSADVDDPTPVRTFCHVYRLFNAADTLLYVGVGYNVAERAKSHRQEKPWWPEVVRGSVMTYPTRRDALAAERQAIRKEAPRYNIAAGGTDQHATVPYRWTPADPLHTWEDIPAAELPAPSRGGDMTDDANLARRVVRWAAEEGAVPSRERVRLRFNIGSKRAERIRGLALELQESAQSDPGPDSVEVEQAEGATG